jgi:hypothetical protein
MLPIMLLAAIVESEAHAAEPLPALSEGWNAWRVVAGESSGTRCCYDWSVGKATMKSCDLDSRRAVSIVNNRQQAVSDEMQLYAFVESGVTTKVMTLSPQCAVESKTPIVDLGLLPNDESVVWLAGHVTGENDLSEDALSAIAAHEGGIGTLIATLENRELPMEIREQSLFWMAQSDTDRAYEYLTALLTR